MKHTFVRFVGGLISFLGIANIINVAKGDYCSEIAYIYNGTKVTQYERVTYTATMGYNQWYYNWPNIQYTGNSLWDVLPEVGYDNLDGGVFLSENLINGTVYHFPNGHSLLDELGSVCVLPASGNFYYVSGSVMFKPGCAIADGTGPHGIYTSTTALAGKYNCCYSGYTTGTSGSSSSGDTECPCYYTEAQSGKTYEYDGNTYSISELNTTRYCFKFINCAPGYYQSEDSPSLPNDGTGEYCFETGPGVFASDKIDVSSLSGCAVPGAVYTSATTEGGNLAYCTNSGCTTTGYLLENWYIPGRCRNQCPSDSSSVNNLVGTASSFQMQFVESTKTTTAGYSAAYSTVGKESCYANYYTATDSNGNTYQVSCDANYQ